MVSQIESSSEEPASFKDFALIWAKIGVSSFGGPAAQIALMHKVIVEEKKWLTESQYLNALNFCMLLPGPEAMQLATYAGWKKYGVTGGLLAGLLFVIPGAALILALAILYSTYGDVPFVESLFLGIKAAVLVIVVEALIKVSRRALKTSVFLAIAVVSFVAIYFLQVAYPLIVILAAIIGFLMGTQSAENEMTEAPQPLSLGTTIRTVLVWFTLWALPIVLLWVGGASEILFEIAVFFSKLAVVTFGGAYAVLAYMAQDVVNTNGWLEPKEMVDGLGLAETTPGPLILVTEFVGFLAAEKVGGIWLGVAGALVTLWVTFLPCFLWIFVGAPYIDRISAQPRLRGALSAITAAVVGVILNLSLWFAIHVLFGETNFVTIGVASFVVPEVETLNWQPVLLGIAAGILLLGFRTNLLFVLAVSAFGGFLTSMI